MAKVKRTAEQQRLTDPQGQVTQSRAGVIAEGANRAIAAQQQVLQRDLQEIAHKRQEFVNSAATAIHRLTDPEILMGDIMTKVGGFSQPVSLLDQSFSIDVEAIEEIGTAGTVSIEEFLRLSPAPVDRAQFPPSTPMAIEGGSDEDI